MKVFICWSEGRSKKIAEELRTWLKMVIQQIDPWMSDEDIRAGARWHSEITSNLADCKVGIICLTPENMKSEWIHFEAGALSKTVEKTYVCPLLIGGLDSKDVPYPLAQFQSKKADKDGIYEIVKTINSILDKAISLSEEMLKKTFDRWWPDLEKVIKELPTLAIDKARRKPDEMLEEILNSVRDLSKMISELESAKTAISAGLGPGSWTISTPVFAPTSRILTRGTSHAETGPIESILVSRKPLASFFMDSEKPTEDNKKPE